MMNPSTGVLVQAHPFDHATPQAASSTTRRGPDDPILARLLHSIARGDAQTFATFYDLTSARLYGSILRVVRSPDHAAEVTQDVYIEIWRTASQYDPARGSVMGWISTMARHRAIDRVRSVSRSARRDAAWATHTPREDTDHSWTAVEQLLNHAQVRAAMRSISTVQHDALTLVYFQGLTHPEAASKLNVPLGTIKTRVRDGLAALRRLVDLEPALS